MRLLPIATTLALAVSLLLAASSVEAQKLYRWTDKDGKVHYSDHVPPEAVENARDELNQSGRTVESVDRALTAEEFEENKRLEAQRKLAEEQEKRDAILLGSYATEADLERSFAERFDLLEQTLESARIGIASQEKSLADLLAHAAGLEQQGKPVPASIQSSLDLARKQTQQQRDFLAAREADKAALQVEYDEILQRYRRLKAAQ